MPEEAPAQVQPNGDVVVVDLTQAVTGEGTVDANGVAQGQTPVATEGPPTGQHQEQAQLQLPPPPPLPQPQQPQLFDIDLEKIHRELFNGRYLTPDAFLEDLAKIVHNSHVCAAQDGDRLVRAQTMYNAAELCVQDFDAGFKLECERMAQRERQRRAERREARKESARASQELEAQQRASQETEGGPRRSARNTGQAPEFAVGDPLQLERRLKRQRSEAPADAQEPGQEPIAKRSRVSSEEGDSAMHDGSCVQAPAPMSNGVGMTGPGPSTAGFMMGMDGVQTHDYHYGSQPQDALVNGHTLPPAGTFPPIAAFSGMPVPFATQNAPAALQQLSPVLPVSVLPPVADFPPTGFPPTHDLTQTDFLPATAYPSTPAAELAHTYGAGPSHADPTHAGPTSALAAEPAPRTGGFDPMLLNPISPSDRFIHHAPTSRDASQAAASPTPRPLSLSGGVHGGDMQMQMDDDTQGIRPPTPMERTPTPLPDFVLDGAALDALRDKLVHATEDLSIEQLEQLRAAALGAVWRRRSEWDRAALLRELDALVEEFVEEVRMDAEDAGGMY
jgi:hypothetical protein